MTKPWDIYKPKKRKLKVKCKGNILKCDCGDCSETKSRIISRNRRAEENGKAPIGRTDRLIKLYYERKA